MHPTSVSLLQRLREPGSKRDAQTWQRFIDLYGPWIFQKARALCRHEADGADLAQEVFTILLRQLERFEHRGPGSFRAFLRGVLRNKWLELSRKRVPAQQDNALLEVAGEDEGGEEEEYRRYLARRALELMQRDFQPHVWKACWETAVEGRPAAEVAAELGTSADVVYAARSRVLRRLREELAELLD